MIHEFNEWMFKIKNIHYADDNLMAKAFERLERNKVMEIVKPPTHKN